MKRDYGIEYISKSIEIFDTIEKILDSKNYNLKDIKKVLEIECLESIRTVERRIREATNYGASEYIKRRNLTKLIYDIYKDEEITLKKIRKYKYKSKSQLEKLCIHYFKTPIEELIKNPNEYVLQEKPTHKSMYYKYLAGEHAHRKRVLRSDNLNNDKIQAVKTRYMGRSGYISLEDGDKLNLYSFTKNMESNLVNCKVDYTIFLRESELKEKIDYVYEKYKDKPLEIDYEYILNLSNEAIELLNTKINSFRHGDEITLNIENDEIVDIIDFYPKAKLLDAKKIKKDINILTESIDRRIKRKLELDDIIVSSGLEVIERIFRFIQAKIMQINIDILSFIDIHFHEIRELHHLILILSVTHISYMNNKLSKTKAKKDINETLDKIVFYKHILLKLDKAIESEIFIDI